MDSRAKHFRPVNLYLDRLYLNVSFDCEIKAQIETNVQKKKTPCVKFNLSSHEAVFDFPIQILCDPRKANKLKITLIIVKNRSTKMVGEVVVDLENDPKRRAGMNKYHLRRCPQKNVCLKMKYEYAVKQRPLNFASLVGK